MSQHQRLYDQVTAQLNLEQMAVFDTASMNWQSRVKSALEVFGPKFDDSVEARVSSEFFGFGPLESLLEDKDVGEILIAGENQIWYEKQGELCQLLDSFLSPLTFVNFFELLCSQSGIVANLQNPAADGSWKDFRVHILLPPVVNEASICLRRKTKNQSQLSELFGENWATRAQLQIIEELVRTRQNLLVIGPTSAGKTTFLNYLIEKINPRERIITMEDSAELIRPQGPSQQLYTRKDGNEELREIDLGFLVRQALRMRPDRLILGEVRGQEAKDLLLALATGHRGSMGTLHADSARQALIRLEMLVQLGAPQWSLRAVRTLIQLSLDALVVVQRSDKGKRFLGGIYRIVALEDHGFILEPMESAANFRPPDL